MGKSCVNMVKLDLDQDFEKNFDKAVNGAGLRGVTFFAIFNSLCKKDTKKLLFINKHWLKILIILSDC